MDISAKSHMSSLDDESVAKIKADLFGKKAETVTETRVTSTLIRRRTKTVRVEPPVEVESPAEKEPVEAAPIELKTETTEKAEAEAATVETEAVPETTTAKETKAETPAVESEAGAKKPAAAEVKPKKPAKKVKKREAAAKIIKMPVAPKEKKTTAKTIKKPGKCQAHIPPGHPLIADIGFFPSQTQGKLVNRLIPFSQMRDIKMKVFWLYSTIKI